MRHRLVREIGMAVLAVSAAACAPADSPRPGRAEAGASPVLQLRFDEVLAPSAFFHEGLATADAPDGAAGFWATAPGLPRPERARVENVATGAQTTVALYAAGGGGAIRLSGAAAEALGIGAEPARVRITALRREPRIDAP